MEPKLANESLAKNGSKCGLFLPFLVICWLACPGLLRVCKKSTSTLAQCKSGEPRSKFVGEMHSHMSQLVGRVQNKELHLVPHMLDNKTQINYTVFTNTF